MAQQEQTAEQNDHGCRCCGQQLFDIGLCLTRLSCADTLTHYGEHDRTEAAHDGPADVIDGKGNGVGGNGNGAEGGYQTGDQDLTDIKKTTLHAVGKADAKDTAHNIQVQSETQDILEVGGQSFPVCQYRSQERKNQAAEGRGDCRAGNTQMKTVDQNGITDHIDHIECNGDDYGLAVLPHGTQHGCGGVSNGGERISQQGDKKVDLGVFVNICFDTAVDQPKQRSVKAQHYYHQSGGHKGGGVQQLISADFGFVIIATADVLGCDNRAAYR